MTRHTTQEATQANLTFAGQPLFTIDMLRDLAVQALVPFGLGAGPDSLTRADSLLIDAGPVTLHLYLSDGSADGTAPRVNISVDKTRDSEALHPRAHIALLAEVTSILIEHMGGDTVLWGAENVAIPATRFQAAFTPMRDRSADEVIHITPRRPGRTAAPQPTVQPEPITLPPLAFDAPDLTGIFREEALEPQDNAPSGATRAATLATTASVAVMVPAIGVPLAVYQAVKGGDIRVSTQAFALSAVLTGMLPSMSYLPFF
ncbi:hypothetical protein [Pseudooceanicola sp. MF1-13]|uniref:hypothetical protein n=1 Tax=Pseudooceanicola sp. MF1-13 TaxID=3379095 RepID=UPI0038919195